MWLVHVRHHNYDLEPYLVWTRGVGQDHVHYKALTKIFLSNVVLLPGASNKSHNNGCIVIIDDYYYY